MKKFIVALFAGLASYATQAQESFRVDCLTQAEKAEFSDKARGIQGIPWRETLRDCFDTMERVRVASDAFTTCLKKRSFMNDLLSLGQENCDNEASEYNILKNRADSLGDQSKNMQEIEKNQLLILRALYRTCGN